MPQPSPHVRSWRVAQPVDATLYLMERWSVLWVEDFIEGLLRQRGRSYGIWKRGESLKAIGRAFGKPSSSIYFLVAPHGGIRPAQRRRSRLADACGTRGDFQRRYGRSIGTISSGCLAAHPRRCAGK